MIRHAIRQNLEFIADREVIEQGVDAREYQYLLLKVVGYTDFRVASPFNLSPLKQRILMMNRSKTARIQLGRFLLVLPLLAVVLISFSSSTSLVQSALLNKWNRNNSWTFKYNQEKKVIYFAGILMDALTGRPIANLPLVLTKHNNPFNKYPQEKTTPDEITHITTDEWPVAHPFLLFGYQQYGVDRWFTTWKSLEHFPETEEVVRNLPVRNPLIWVQE